MKAHKLRPGMSIVEDNGKSFRVNSVATFVRNTAGSRTASSCSVGCIHVNNTMCYDVDAELTVKSS